MSTLPLDLSDEPTRRAFTERQARTVRRLCEATCEELRAKGYEGMTVRNVARRAGVAAATAYTYFASKEHLITETLWRRMSALPGPQPNRRRGVAGRVTDALADFAQLIADEPELISACTIAMVADDPDVKHLRERVGTEIHRRFVSALGRDADRDVLIALNLAMTGAMIRAGTGHMTFEEIPERMGEVAALLLERRP